jgi:hypothetical protein
MTFKRFLDGARQIDNRLRTIAQCAGFDFRAVPIWHETAVLIRPAMRLPARSSVKAPRSTSTKSVGRARSGACIRALTFRAPSTSGSK